jgi:hypothetical protein
MNCNLNKITNEHVEVFVIIIYNPLLDIGVESRAVQRRRYTSWLCFQDFVFVIIATVYWL